MAKPSPPMAVGDCATKAEAREQLVEVGSEAGHGLGVEALPAASEAGHGQGHSRLSENGCPACPQFLGKVSFGGGSGFGRGFDSAAMTHGFEADRPQHLLNFLLLPQGHASLRPILAGPRSEDRCRR